MIHSDSIFQVSLLTLLCRGVLVMYLCGVKCSEFSATTPILQWHNTQSQPLLSH